MVHQRSAAAAAAAAAPCTPEAASSWAVNTRSWLGKSMVGFIRGEGGREGIVANRSL